MMNQSDDTPAIDEFLRSAGEVRLLAGVIQPLRTAGSMPPLSLEVQMGTVSNADQERNVHRVSQRIMLVLRAVSAFGATMC
jgi:hypothetical protein